MKKIFRKNQVVITVLAFLIAIAGYISYDKTNTTTADSDATADAEAADAEAADAEATAADAADSDAAADANADVTDAEGSDSDTEDAWNEAEYDIVFVDDTETSGAADSTDTTESDEDLNPGEAVLTSTITSSTDYASEIKLNRETVRSQNKETLNAIIENESLTDEQKTEAVAQLTEITDIAEKEVEAETLLEAKGFLNVVVSITDETCDVVLDMGEVTDAKLSQVEDIVKRKTGVSAENIVITAINTESYESLD